MANNSKTVILTAGALSEIKIGVFVDNPILQVIEIKIVSNKDEVDRYRLHLSDGTTTTSCVMLTNALSPLISCDQITLYSIIKVEKYHLNLVPLKPAERIQIIMVISKVQILVPGNEVGKVLFIDESTSEPVPSMNTSKIAEAFLNNSINLTKSEQLSTTPIEALTPYTSSKWVIKARVIWKSEVKPFMNGGGKLFSFTLKDISGEIRCVVFNEDCEKFYNLIMIGYVYYLSKATLKQQNKNFNKLHHPFEIHFKSDTVVMICNEDTRDVPQLNYKFQSIASIEEKRKNEFVDILGLVQSCSEVKNVTERNMGRNLKVRDLMIIDESNTSIKLTLWGTQAENFDGSSNPILAIKQAKIGEFLGGKSLALVSSQSMFQINPNIPEAHRLKKWYQAVGHSQPLQRISRLTQSFCTLGTNADLAWVTFKEVEDFGYGLPNKQNIYNVKASIDQIFYRNIIYQSCPNENCKKKVCDIENGLFYCERCNKEYSNFVYRYSAWV